MPVAICAIRRSFRLFSRLRPSFLPASWHAPQRQDTHPRTHIVDRNKRTALQLPIESLERRKQCIASTVRRYIIRADLDYARSLRVRHRQQRAKIQVTSEYDKAMLLRPRDQFAIRCPRIAYLRLVHSFMTGNFKRLHAHGREIHINQQPHAVCNGTSISSARHAAYVSASSISAGSRYG